MRISGQETRLNNRASAYIPFFPARKAVQGQSRDSHQRENWGGRVCEQKRANIKTQFEDKWKSKSSSYIYKLSDGKYCYICNSGK